MKFNAWELAALEQALWDSIKRGGVEEQSAKRLIARLQKEKPKKAVRS